MVMERAEGVQTWDLASAVCDAVHRVYLLPQDRTCHRGCLKGLPFYFIFCIIEIVIQMIFS